MSALTIPHINNNDTHAILVEWCVEDGESVSVGTVVAVLETSKSTFDLEATEDGELHIEKEAGEEYPFGERIGSIGDVGDLTVKTASEAGESSEDFGRDFIITRSAREIIEKHGVDEAALSRSEVAARMMRFRVKAMRGRFDQAELIGGALSLSLNMDADTVFVRPLILRWIYTYYVFHPLVDSSCSD